MAGMTPDAGGAFAGSGQSNAAFKQQLNKIYAWYTGGFVLFVVVVFNNLRRNCYAINRIA